MQQQETFTGKYRLNFVDGYPTQRDFKLELLRLIDYNKDLLGVLIESLEHNIAINHGGKTFSPSTSDQAKIFFSKKDRDNIAEEITKCGFVPLLEQNFYDQPTDAFVKFDEKNLPVAFVVFGKKLGKSSSFKFSTMQGQKSVVEELTNNIDKYLFFSGSKTGRLRVVNGFDFYGSMEFRDEIIDKTVPEALQCFYPWMTQSIESYIDDFMKSSSPILFLIGEPRTGKTSLIRTIAKRKKASLQVGYDESVITHKNFIDEYMRAVNNKRAYGNPQPEILVVEDADNFVRSRKQGNQSMAKILNISQGIGDSRMVKMIFSTNLDEIGTVDPALLGPGRCFDILHFRKLTADEAAVVRKEMNLPEVDFSKEERKEFTLGEILNENSFSKKSALIKPRFFELESIK